MKMWKAFFLSLFDGNCGLSAITGRKEVGTLWNVCRFYFLMKITLMLSRAPSAFSFSLISLINCLIALWRFGLIIAIPNSCNLQDLINGRKKQHLHYDFCQQLFNVCGHLKTFKTIYPIFWITFTLCLKMENWHHGLSTKPRNWCCCWLSWQGELGHCRDAQILQMVVVLRLYVEFSRAS